MPTEYEYDRECDEIDEALKEQERKQKTLNKITSFLNSFEKEYEVRVWDSGEGIDIIVKEYDSDNDKTYFQTISLYDHGFLRFEKQKEQSGELTTK